MRALFALLSLVCVFGFEKAQGHVGSDGSFSYAIPIELPSAPGNHRPELRLVYGSNYAGAYLGQGWNLSGLSAIQRMDFGAGIRFSKGDTFTGPEGRLVAISARDFRAASDNGSVTTPLFQNEPGVQGACDVENGEPCAWRMIDRFGTTHIFGGTPDSRISAFDAKSSRKQGNPIRVWAVSSVRDVQGNVYDVTYRKSQQSGAYYPSEVRYSGNRIALEYCDSGLVECPERTGMFSHHADGSYVESSLLLKSITVHDASGGSLTYALQYDESAPDGPRLIAIAARGSDGVAGPQHKFEWGRGFNALAASTLAITGGFHATNFKIHTGDFNGDGRTDILRTTEDSNNHFLFLSNGNGFDEGIPITVPDGVLHKNDASVRIHLADFNGDGRTDILRTSDTGNNPRLLLSNGKGFDDKGVLKPTDGYFDRQNGSVKLHLGDFNGDGRIDILRTADNNNHRLFLSNGAGFDDKGPVKVPEDVLYLSNNTSRIYLADFNGDGRTDILRTGDHTNNPRLFLSNGAGFDDVGGPLKLDGPLDMANRSVRIHLGDFNGDGRTDILRTSDAHNHRLFLSNGRGFEDAGQLKVSSNNYLDHTNDTIRIHLGDFNGDGRTDVLRTGESETDTLLLLSTGRGFVEGESVKVPEGLIHKKDLSIKAHLGDFNGDGRIDILRTRDTNVTLLASSGAPTDELDAHLGAIGTQLLSIENTLSATGFGKLRKVTDPQGGEVRVLYGLLSNYPDAIQYDVQCPEPVASTAPTCGVPSAGPQVVVKAIAESDGRTASGWSEGATPVDRVTFYKYSNSRLYPGDRAAARPLGFGMIGQYDVAKLDGTYVVRTSQLRTFEQTAYFVLPDVQPEVLVRSPFVGQLKSERAFLGQPSSANRISEMQVSFARAAARPDAANPTIARALVSQRESMLFDKGSPIGSRLESRRHDEQGRISWQRLCNQLASDQATGREPDCLSIETSFAAWSYSSPWPADQVLAQKTTAGLNIVSASRFTYFDANKPIRLQTTEDFVCPNSLACDEGLGKWVVTTAVEQYDDRGRVIASRDAKDAQTRYTYDGHGHVTSETRSAGDVSLKREYTYDSFGRLLTSKDENGYSIQHRYDSVGRIVERTSSMGLREQFDYVNPGNPQSQYRQLTQERTVRLNAQGAAVRERLVTKTFHDGWGYHYLIESDSDSLDTSKKIRISRHRAPNSEGSREQVSYPYFSDEKPIWTIRTYDLRGRLLASMRPDGTEERYAYEGVRRAVSRNYGNTELDPAQLSTTYEYFDLTGRLVRRLDADRGLTDFKYDHNGRIVEVLLPTDRRNTRQKISATYDSFGRRLRLEDPAAGTLSFEFDDKGNLARQRDSQGKTEYIYDGFGRVMSWVSERNGKTEKITFEYDKPYGTKSSALGRLSKVEDASGTRRIGYDPNGSINWIERHIKGLSEPLSEQFRFNDTGELMRYQYPDGASLAYEYSRRGNVTRMTLSETAGSQPIASFSDFNASDRARSVTYGNGIQTRFDYSDSGLLKGNRVCRNGCAQVLEHLNYAFNRMGLVSGITDARGEGSTGEDNRQFTYDVLGRLSRANIGKERDAAQIDYLYSAIGTLERRSVSREGQQTDFRNYVHDGQKLLGAFAVENYTDAHRLIDVFTNEAGQITAKSVRATPDAPWERWDYAYDALQRLSRASRKVDGNSVRWADFTYDYSGRRASKTSGLDKSELGASWYFSPTFELHASGDSKQVVTIKHVIGPAVGRLAVIRRTEPREKRIAPKALTATPSAALLDKARGVYDPSLARTLPSAMTKVQKIDLKGGAAKPLADKGVVAISAQQFIVAGSDAKVVGVFFIHNDYLSSTDLVTDAKGNVWQRLQYGPYGELLSDKSQGKSIIGHRFTGYEWDEETGLYYAGARYYDPTLNQFLSPDPVVPAIFSSQAFNRYAYAFNNPTTYRDPSGRFFIVAAIITGAIVGGTYTALKGGSIEDVLRGAVIGGAAFGTGAWAGAAVGGAGLGSALAAGAAGGAVQGGLGAAFSGQDVLQGALRGAAMGAVGGAVGYGIGYAGSYASAPALVTRAAAAVGTCKLFGCSNEQALEAGAAAMYATAVNRWVSPQGGRPLTQGEKRGHEKLGLKGMDLDKVRVYKGGIFTAFGDSAVTMDNNITFRADLYSDNFSLVPDMQGTLAHEIFHAYEYQTSSYHWTDAMFEHIRYSDPYGVPGTHEHRADQYQADWMRNNKN